MKLFGREWTRREIEANIGRIEQIGGLFRRRCAGGLEDGCDVIRLETGAGLAVDVLPTRALDLGRATYAGSPLTWTGPNGYIHPALTTPDGLLHGFAGGLMTTCGLSSMGVPQRDEGDDLPLHGRAWRTPAAQVCARGAWEADEYVLRVSGEIEERSLLGHHLRLNRSILAVLGTSRLEVTDCVENLGFRPAPHMLLYHCNFGFPLLDQQARIRVEAGSVRARDEAAKVNEFDRWPIPQAGPEQAFYHESLLRDPDGWATACVEQPAFPVGARPTPLTLRLRWSANTLPVCVQWKQTAPMEHVLGLEPATGLVEGRAKERAEGRLLLLPPGDSLTHRLVFEVTEGMA